jgi:hypothetical protein
MSQNMCGDSRDTEITCAMLEYKLYHTVFSAYYLSFLRISTPEQAERSKTKEASRPSLYYSIVLYEKDEKGMKKTSIGRTGTYNRSVIGHTGTYYPSDTADKREVARTAPRAYSGLRSPRAFCKQVYTRTYRDVLV